MKKLKKKSKTSFDNTYGRKKAEIKNILTLPYTVLQLLLHDEKPRKSDIKTAKECIDKTIALLNSL